MKKKDLFLCLLLSLFLVIGFNTNKVYAAKTDIDGDGLLEGADNDQDGDGMPSDKDPDDTRYTNISYTKINDIFVVEGKTYGPTNYNSFINKKIYKLEITPKTSYTYTYSGNGTTPIEGPATPYIFTNIGATFTKTALQTLIVDGYDLKGYENFVFAMTVPYLNWHDDVSNWRFEETKKFVVDLLMTMDDGKVDSMTLNDATKAKLKADTVRSDFNIILQRDTDKDGIPDVTDPDDDNDGYTDEAEKEAKTNPKDPNSKPGRPIVTITPKTQDVLDNKPIKTITYTVSKWGKNTSVSKPTSLSVTDRKVTGSIDVTDWGKTEEVRTTQVKVTTEDLDGTKISAVSTIRVLRDTDNDGDPDITDPDDDDDGYTDEEEKKAGTDPKDPNSHPKESDKFIPQVITIIANKGDPVNIIPGLVNPPKGSTVTVKTDVSSDTTGNKTGTVTVTFKDGSTKDVDIPVIIVDNQIGLEVEPPYQEVIEYKPIKPVDVSTKVDAKVTVTPGDFFKPTNGVNNNIVKMDDKKGKIEGTVDITNWGKTEEERIIKVPVKAQSDNLPDVEKEISIKVLRDTDKDGDPDITDPDDDNDGYTDEEEKKAGTDPKDPNSHPGEKNTGINPKTGVKSSLLALFIISIIGVISFIVYNKNKKKNYLN